MSRETREALDKAIRDHIADEHNGAVVTAYGGIISAKDSTDFEEQQTQYFTIYDEFQEFHVGLGLARRHMLLLEADC